MTKGYKFSEDDLLEVMDSVDSSVAEEVEKLAGITFNLKEEKKAYIGANLTYGGEFYLGNIFGVTGTGELTEIFGFMSDEDELIITEILIQGKAKYITNYIDLTGENIRFPSGWEVEY